MERVVPTSGIHQVSFKDYCEWDALNWSTLKNFRKSAKHGRHALLHPGESSEAMEFGEAVHAAILEPLRFESLYVTMPKFSGHHASAGHKEEKRLWIEANKSKIHLTIEERECLHAIAQSVRSHPIVKEIISGKGRNEMSICWNGDGVTKKGRIDRLTRIPYGLLKPSSGNSATNVLCLVDLKTTKDASPEAFARDMANYAYHGQAAWYIDGMTALSPAAFVYVIIAIEKTAPYDCVPYLLPEETVEQGRMLYQRLLKLKSECEEKKHWPGISEESAIPLNVPRWAMEVEHVA